MSMSDCEERRMRVMTLNVCMLPLFLRNRDLPSQVTETSCGPISSCLDRDGSRLCLHAETNFERRMHTLKYMWANTCIRTHRQITIITWPLCPFELSMDFTNNDHNLYPCLVSTEHGFCRPYPTFFRASFPLLA